jgi:hypothetical protein
MSSTVLSGTPPTHAAHRGLPATFAALLRKDLRLATIIILPSLAALALLSLVAVITPLLGEAAMRALGLLALEGRGVLARIGAFATLFWITSVFACVLSALAIAAGDSSGRARHLLPVLPVSSRMAYASKTCACALVIAGFLCVTGAVQMSGDATMIQSGSIFGYGLLLANGVVWAFVAPLFARTFGGAFVVTIVTPMLLFLACSVVGDAIAFFALKWTLISRDAAPWFGDGSLAESGGLGFEFSMLISNRAWTCSAVVVLAVGLWCAWHARKAVLCARSVRGVTRLGVVRVVACVFAAAGCSGIGAAAVVWNDNPAISRALVAAGTYESYRTMPVDELVRRWGSYWAFVDSNRATLFDRSDERHGFEAMFWPIATQDGPASVGSLDPEELIARRLITRAIGERLESDPEGVRAAARALLDADAPRSPIEQVRLAELIGPRTRASVLLHRLAAGPSREETRVDLIMLLTPCLSMLDPQWDNMSKWRRQPGEWLGGVDQHAWGLAPFRIDCGGGPKSCPMASARAEAVVFVTALEKRIEEGTFEPTDARSPHDRLSVGKAVLRAARHALEPSFPRLADHRLADSPWLKDATRAPSVTDDQSLYLPASLLFDHAQTDSSYLLPTGH